MQPAAMQLPAMQVDATPGAVLFDDVTKFDTSTEPPQLIFGGLSFALPPGRNTAIVGRRQSGRTTLLGLLAGRIRPDGGRVLKSARGSMVLNARPFLNAQLNGIENARLLARLYGIDEERLTRLAVTLPCIGPNAWHEPVRGLEIRDRRSLEMLLAAMLPYDFYLVDDVEKADPNVFALLLKFANARGAGVVFAGFNMKAARQHADYFGVIAERSLYFCDSVQRAEAYYDR